MLHSSELLLRLQSDGEKHPSFLISLSLSLSPSLTHTHSSSPCLLSIMFKHKNTQSRFPFFLSQYLSFCLPPPPPPLLLSLSPSPHSVSGSLSPFIDQRSPPPTFAVLRASDR